MKAPDQKKNHLIIIIERYNVTVKRKKKNTSKVFDNKILKVNEHTVDLKIEIWNDKNKIVFFDHIKIMSSRFLDTSSNLNSQIKLQTLVANELNLKLKKKLRNYFLVNFGDYVIPY